jgi:hypothetical protein
MNGNTVSTAHRVHQREAAKVFAAGGTVLVSERGHETEIPVTNLTTVHSRETTSWDELVDVVTMWRGRYPNQRFYVVSPCESDISTNHSDDVLTIWRGRPVPTVMCGYHAMRGGLS